MNVRRLAVICGMLLLGGFAHAETLRVQGSTTVATIFTAASSAIKDKLDLDVKVRAEHGSTEAIHSAAAGAVDLAVVTRGLEPEDRSDFPERRLTEVPIGIHALVFIVSADVWESGVRSISKAEARALYEGSMQTWKTLGGSDHPIRFFNPDRGRGVWEFMTLWLYGDARKAPLGQKWETVPGGREARDSVGFNAGTISIANARWADGKTAFALAIKDSSGETVAPTTENIQTLKYPFARKLYLVAGDRPTGNLKRLINFMLSTDGQSFVKKAEFVGLQDPKPLE